MNEWQKQTGSAACVRLPYDRQGDGILLQELPGCFNSIKQLPFIVFFTLEVLGKLQGNTVNIRSFLFAGGRGLWAVWPPVSVAPAPKQGGSGP